MGTHSASFDLEDAVELFQHQLEFNNKIREFLALISIAGVTVVWTGPDNQQLIWTVLIAYLLLGIGNLFSMWDGHRAAMKTSRAIREWVANNSGNVDKEWLPALQTLTVFPLWLAMLAHVVVIGVVATAIGFRLAK